MASIVKTPQGYRAHIYVSGQRDSKLFRTKREADAWAAATETALREQAGQVSAKKVTLRAALKRYLAEVTPKKRGARGETNRINAFLKNPFFPSHKYLHEIAPQDLADWRNERLKKVSDATVIREFGVLSAFFEHARREWRLISSNPVRDVRKPPTPKHREIVIGWRDIRAMLRSLNYRVTGDITEPRQAVGAAFLIALHTGMRSGEICGLTWDRVHKDHCVLPVTKTVPRKVPFEPRTMRVINQMRGWSEIKVFGMTPESRDLLFRKYRDKAGLSGFTFHDTRHTAATLIARRLDVLDLCKMFGWSSTKQALTYYNPSASDIAKRLAEKRR